MIELTLNVILSASIISLALWMAKTSPVIGGFIISLPLSTLITLALSKIQTKEVGSTVLLAKSIFVGVPASLLFFVPFFFAERLKISFWQSYFMGLVLLLVSFAVHRWIMSHWG